MTRDPITFLTILYVEDDYSTIEGIILLEDVY